VDALDQRFPVPAGQIGASETAGEDRIPAKYQTFGSTVEDHMPRAVSGCVVYLERVLPDSQYLGWLQEYIRLGGGLDANAKPLCPAFHAPQKQISRMKGNGGRRSDTCQEIAYTSEMVEVGVGDPDLPDAPAALLRLSSNDLPIPGGIDHRCLAGDVVGNQITIRSYWPKNEWNNLQHPLSRSELAIAGIA